MDAEAKKKMTRISVKVIIGAVAFMVVLSILINIIEKPQTDAFLKSGEEYLSSFDVIKDYRLTKDSAIVYLDRASWDRLSTAQKLQVGYDLSYSLTAYRKQAGLSVDTFFLVAIYDQYHNHLGTTDAIGTLKLEE